MSESNFWGEESGPVPHIVQGPDGVDFPTRLRLQFSGAVSVTDTDGKTVVMIPSGRRGEPGPSGDTGPMPTIAAEAEPLVYTSEPRVEATPTPTGVLLTFGIPQGIPGERGPQGGTTIQIGAVMTGEPGTAASVTNTGTVQDVVLSFTIPRGEQGAPGPQGEPGAAGIDGAPIWQLRGE